MKTAVRFLVAGAVLTSVSMGDTDIQATRVTSSLVLDGQLVDEVWGSAALYDQFATYVPDYGRAPAQTTHFQIAYDNQYLYIAVEAFDSDPGQIKAAVSNWDNLFQDDWIGVVLDTYNDGQTAYGFLVNGHGSQADGTMASDGVFDATEDFIWSAAGAITPRGYVVEIQIPWKSLRFQSGNEVIMGLSIFRNLSRHSEKAIFPAIGADRGAFLSQLGKVKFEQLGYERVVEILPVITQSADYSNDAGELRKVSFASRSPIGITAKVGLTPTMILDFTLKPDFSQVEADAPQVGVNLRVPNFFREKRPFFLEGIGNFGMAGVGFGRLLHTRTIASPSVGVKLSGKVGASNVISALFTVDESPLYIDYNGAAATHSIVRYRRLLSQDSYLGGIAINRSHAIGHNAIGGVDGKWRLNGKINVQGNLIFATLSDASSPNPRTGSTGSVVFLYSDRINSFSLGYQDISADFSGLVSTGFIPRDGHNTLSYSAMRSYYPEGGLLQRIRGGMIGRSRHDKVYDMNEWKYLWHASFILPRSTSLTLHYHFESEIFAGQRFSRNGPMMFFSTQIVPSLRVGASIIAGGTPIYNVADPAQGDLTVGSFSLNYKPSDKLTADVSASRTTIMTVGDAASMIEIKLLNTKLTYHLNKYLFFRGTVRYNDFSGTIGADMLASFTYIPGTVIHLGYGTSLLETDDYPSLPQYGGRFTEVKRAMFFKASYNWRI